jgi:NADH dehydrogenase
LLAFEEAERETDVVRREKLMRSVIIGGGPTGVEMAGAIAELAKRVLADDFKNVEPERAQIILLEVAPRLLLPFSEKLSASAKRQLEKLGVEVRLNQKIREIREGVIELEGETLEAENIIWGAGVRASPVCDQLGVEQDKAGRLKVCPDLSLPGHPEAFALGDIVHLTDAEGKPVPGVSPAAIQMGSHAAKVIGADIDGQRNACPFIYNDKGSMATIGRSKAVAQIGQLGFSGFMAWLTWLFVHLIFLIGFRNKVFVLIQWFYSYVNYRRGSRIITGLDRIFKTGNPVARPVSKAEKRSREPERKNTTTHAG